MLEDVGVHDRSDGLSQGYGSPVGQDMFSTQALASAVGARTVGGTRWRFRWAFADFAVWNARPGKYYDEGAAYPTAAVARTKAL